MLIIIEGTDCTYKSTVCNKLSEQLNIPIIKGSSFEIATGTEQSMYEHFKMISTSKQPMIVDRYLYSNLTYAPLYPKYTMISPEHAKEIEDDLNKRDDVHVFYLYAHVDALKQRMEERGDEMIKSDELGAINKKYNQVLSESNFHLFHMIDTEFFNSDEIVEHILKRVRK